MTIDAFAARPAVSIVDYDEADSFAALLVKTPPDPIAHLFTAGPPAAHGTRIEPMAAMLLAVVDTLPGNVFAKDREGRYIVANAQTERALGAPRDRLLGRTDVELIGDGAEAARLREADLRVMASGTAESLEETLTLADGAVATWLSTKAPLRDATGAVIGVIGFSVDITARRAAEQERARIEAQLGAVLDALPVGIIIADADGRIVRDNAANRDLWGVPPETASWRDYGDWVGFRPATGERIAPGDWAMARALRHGDTVRGELVECQRFGSGERRRYLNNAAPVRDADGAIIGGVVAALDVTDGVPAGCAGAN
jgi:PAS domain S-box-containing protein